MKRKSNAGPIDASKKRGNRDCLVFDRGTTEGYPEIGVFKWRCLSVRNTGVLCGLTYYLLLGIEETITSSYFSVEARKRGLSPTEVGVAFSMMEAGNFCFSFLIMYFITPNSERLFCVSGIFLSAIATGISGALQWVRDHFMFFGLSIITKLLIGAGAASTLSTVLPLTTALSSQNSGTVIAWAESLLSFGTLLGPPLGSLIYHFSAFSVAPFVACALLFINAILFSIFGKRWEGRTLSISCIISTDGTSGEHEQAERSEDTVQRGASVSAAGAKFDPLAYLKFVTHPSILGVSLFGIMASAQITFFDVCLSLYLTDTFHLNAPKIGLMFVAHTLSNVTMTPFYGIAIDRGYSTYVLVFCAFGYSCSMFLLYLPVLFSCLHTIWYLTLCFIVCGSFSAGAYVPCYLLCERISCKNSIANATQTKLLVSTWLNNIFSVGALVGSLVLSGPVFQKYGFNETCLSIAVAMIAVMMLCILCLKRENLFTKLFYRDDFVHDLGEVASRDSSITPQISSSGSSEFCGEDDTEDMHLSDSSSNSSHMIDAVSDISSVFQDDITLLRL